MVRKKKPRWIFFTVLDSTLLDHASYQWAAARLALGPEGWSRAVLGAVRERRK